VLKCYNCGKKGRYKSECRKPLKTNESKNDVHEDSYVALYSDNIYMKDYNTDHRNGTFMERTVNKIVQRFS
jgi:hypothetical protein